MTPNTTHYTDNETTSRAFTEMLRAHPAHKPSIILAPPSSASTSAPQPVLAPVPAAAPAPASPPPPPPRFQFMPVDYFTEFQLPSDAILVGDCHLTRGDITLIAGVPGCGKSRLLMSLAIAGAQGHGSTWMGLRVHAKFKTFILQAENGEMRLKQELLDIDAQGHDLRGHLYVTPPPSQGIAFTDPAFCHELRTLLARERPGVFAIDPWNRAVPDDKVRDFREVLDAVQSCMPEGPDKPAIVIIHHLRKGHGGDARKTGRDLLNEVSGSYVIGAACRSAFILEPASPAPEDNRVIFTCAKNNNGEMGKSTAWHRQNGLFAPCEDFDWKEWREGGSKSGATLDDLEAIFEGGKKVLSRGDAVRLLCNELGLSRSGAYKILATEGRFAAHLSEENGFITFTP